MTVDWNAILQQVLAGVIALVGIAVTMVLRHLWAYLREQAAKIADARLRAFVRELVDAAEQIFGAAKGKGPEKREYVLGHLANAGVPVAKAAPLLEAVVWDAKGWSWLNARHPKESETKCEPE